MTMAAKKKKDVVDLTDDSLIEETVEEVPETPATAEEKPSEETAPAEVPTVAPETEAWTEPATEESLEGRMKKILWARMGEGGNPTLVQFEQRSGRPCTVLMEMDEGAVREAWDLWCSERGRNQEAFVTTVLGLSDAWPARIMKPCSFVNLGRGR